MLRGEMDEPDRRDGAEAFAETQIGLGAEAASPHVEAPSGTQGAGGPSPSGDAEADGFVGRVLGGLYQVERKLGEGGMGAVYLVRHVHLRKHFAVKVLSPQIAANRQAVDRLHQEAVAASSIDHENIVDIVNFDVTEQDEVFIVMELLEGPSLAQVLETQGRLPPERALPIAVQISRALQAAHERGIVHRDLKPENVMLVRKHGRELVKVLDFGISKVRSAEAEQVRVTRTGQLVGTPLYMSPEQARGDKEIDHRADVYALGVMLYEMLTGTPPFDGANYFQLLWKHGNEPPEPPRKRAPEADISEALEAVILRAMAKEPAERFQSMRELEEALLGAEPQRALPSGSMPAGTPSTVSLPPAPARAARPKALLFGLGAALLVGGLALGASWRGGGGSETARSAQGAESGGQAAGHAGNQGASGVGDRPPGPGAREAPASGAVPEPAADARATDASPGDGGAATGADASKVAVRLESTPPGASVWLDGERLGRTPLQVALPAEPSARTFVFRKPGYRERRVEAEVGDGTVVRAKLQRRTRRQSSGGAALPIKTEL